MVSQIKVNEIIKQSGSSITIGSSGDTVALGSGASQSGFGKVAQIIQGTSSAEGSTTSTSYVTTNLSASITPSATTSKILIQSYLRLTPYKASGTSASLGATIYRDSSNILTATQTNTIQAFGNGSNAIGMRMLTPLIFLDSPSSTSSITYAIYVKAESGSTAYYHQSTCQGSIILTEILA